MNTESENIMFDNIENNQKMIRGSYKKLKSYYFHNKNFIFMREKIAEFEYDLDVMENKFFELATLLVNPNLKKNKEKVELLINQIDFYVLPKSFEIIESKKKVVSNTMEKNKEIKKVNFFIDMPIELHILDTLWTLLLGKVSFDQKLLSVNCYGNTLNAKLLYNKSENFYESIKFDNNRMFNIYFYKYTEWKNNAFDRLEKNYGKKHSLLISLDIKGYYYSVSIDFRNLKTLFNNDINLSGFKNITKIFEKVYERYVEIIKPYHKELNIRVGKGLPLPIGLFSSMLFGNIYLKDFDQKIIMEKNISYYGRYVDDMLLVFDVDSVEDSSIKTVMKKTLIDNAILNEKDSDNYTIVGKENLLVQNSKIKIIHIHPNETRAIIDAYNKYVKVIPSQINVLPDYNLDITDFEESAYMIENLTQEKKLRDIGNMSVDAFKVSRYLTTLVQKQKSLTYKDSERAENIKGQLKKIYNFFSGNQSIEFNSNWINIFYFLVLNGNKKEIKVFYNDTKKNIKNLNFKSLDDEIKDKRKIGKKVKDTLYKHLKICLCTALAIRQGYVADDKYQDLTKKIQKSNMFNHYLVAYPLINYIDNGDIPISLSTMQLKDIYKYDRNIMDNFKIKWSPRFIKLEELFLYWFIFKYDKGGNNYLSSDAEKKLVQDIIDRFYKINNINIENIDIDITTEKFQNEYIKQTIKIGDDNYVSRDKLKIAVANVNIKNDDCTLVLKNPWATLVHEKKKQLFQILKQAYGDSKDGKEKVDFLVLPEFYLPLKWLNEVLDFSRKSQIGIITGIQYLTDINNNAYNYIATILPFEKNKYKNVFLLIREKNDYSPLEKTGLAEMQFKCKDAKFPTYQVYNWKNIDFGTLLCYEFTDIMARSLYKGKVDVLFTPEFNKDTTYFSNIIESAVRDLHTVIVQANTSKYGDSRISGPYSRDHRNIVQIKGGDNNGLIIGTVNLSKIQEYQANYYDKLDQEVKNAYNKITPKINKNRQKLDDEIKISKLSARYDVVRAKNKRDKS